PVARVVLSHPLGIFPLVGRHPANQVIPREPLPRRLAAFGTGGRRPPYVARNYPRFPGAVPVLGAGCPRLTAPCATRRGPGLLPGRPRATCMPNPRRQRSF